MAQRGRRVTRVIGASLFALLLNCSDNPVEPAQTETSPPRGMVVSGPEPLVGSASRSGVMSLFDDGDLVYVSVYPNTVPHAASVVIQNPSARFTLAVAASDGGIDPVPVPARPGDSVIVVVTDSSGQSVRFAEMVRAARPPSVVRTEPPRRKTDVPINAALMVVFSEPMDSASITSQSMQLVANGQAVASYVVLGADRLRATLVPDAGLAPNTSYTLVATTGVHNRTGLALAQNAQVDFTTGSTTNRATSLTVSPAAATLPVGSVLQLAVTLRDFNGNAIQYIRPLLWSTSNGAVVAITPDGSGLARALQPGRATISAVTRDTIQGLGQGSAIIDVVPAASLDIGGVWDWTETITDPGITTCSDTGSYQFAQTGSAFTGTSRQVGVCGTSDNTRTDAVSAGSAGGNSLNFAVLDCSYAATVTTGAPDQLSGTVSCGPTATGTWAAHRAGPVGSVMVLPAAPPVLLPGNTVPLTAALWDAAGNRVFFRTLTWTSDHPEVAGVSGVSDSGVVTAVAPGTATISAAADGKSASVVVTVTTPASIRVTTTTTGVDRDADGYTVSVSEEQTQAVASEGVVTFGGLGVGTYSVMLTGVADNCAVAGPNPTTANTVLAETTTVAFTISCTAAGSLQVTTSSTGTDIPAQYGVQVDAGPLLTVNANGQLTVSPLGARSHSVGLFEPVNCTVAGENPRTVEVTAGATAQVAFQVSCVAIGRVAFYDLWDNNIAFVSMNADGSDRVTFPVRGFQAVWSPDGARVAYYPFSSDCGRGPDSPAPAVVCIMNADGTGVVALPIGTTLFPGGLSWSPDGSRIAYQAAGGLYTVNVDGSGTLQVTSGIPASFPAWSPDGSRIAFTCVVDTGNNDICTVNADGTGVVRLTSDPADDHHPSWKPDGSKIAFATGRYGYDNDGNPTIVVMNPDGSGVIPLGVGDAPAWSPDGGRIALALVPINSCDPDYGCPAPVFAVRRADGSGLTVPGYGHYFGASGDAPAWKP